MQHVGVVSRIFTCMRRRDCKLCERQYSISVGHGIFLMSRQTIAIRPIQTKLGCINCVIKSLLYATFGWNQLRNRFSPHTWSSKLLWVFSCLFLGLARRRHQALDIRISYSKNAFPPKEVLSGNFVVMCPWMEKLSRQNPGFWATL